MKEIDLDKIIEDTLGVPARLMKEGERLIIRDCVKAGINQALDIASEEAEILDNQTGISWMGILNGKYEVCKKSILDIKNRIK